MNKEEQKHHLHSISSTIGAVHQVVDSLSYEQFEQNEQVKEQIYEYLQEIGQAASQLQNGEPDIDIDFNVLNAFKNARYNQEVEMDHHSVWSIIKVELPKISDEIEQSNLYNLV